MIHYKAISLNLGTGQKKVVRQDLTPLELVKHASKHKPKKDIIVIYEPKKENFQKLLSNRENFGKL